MRPTLFLGDTHGDLRAIKAAAHAVAHRPEYEDIERLFVLGDFGFVWNAGKNRLPEVAAAAEKRGLEVWWIDGNHENFTEMDRIGLKSYGEGPVEKDGVTYVPRGCVWEENGVVLGACGGAVSVDQQWRTLGESWWVEEMITDSDIERAAAYGGGVDLMLSHDVPVMTARLRQDLAQYGMRIDYKMDALSIENRTRLAQIWAEWGRPPVLHGHYHIPYVDFAANGAAMRGLADGSVELLTWFPSTQLDLTSE